MLKLILKSLRRAGSDTDGPKKFLKTCFFRVFRFFRLWGSILKGFEVLLRPVSGAGQALTFDKGNVEAPCANCCTCKSQAKPRLSYDITSAQLDPMWYLLHLPYKWLLSLDRIYIFPELQIPALVKSSRIEIYGCSL